jgi:hypothetical protein
MRRRFGIVAVCSALAVAGAVPASAADLSGSDVGDAYSIMLTPSEAKSLAGGTKMTRVFAVASALKGEPDSPWLCDLSGSDEVEGKGAQETISSEYLSQRGQAVGDATQEIHVYRNAKQAKAAYDDIVKNIKRCEGQHTPDPDDAAPGEGDEGTGFTTQLTNGEKKAADGDPFLWVRSNTTIPGQEGFAEHGYTTVRHFGRYLQIIQVQSEGNGAPGLTAKQIRQADRLTDSLGDRWRATFG